MNKFNFALTEHFYENELQPDLEGGITALCDLTQFDTSTAERYLTGKPIIPLMAIMKGEEDNLEPLDNDSIEKINNSLQSYGYQLVMSQDNFSAGSEQTLRLK